MSHATPMTTGAAVIYRVTALRRKCPRVYCYECHLDRNTKVYRVGTGASGRRQDGEERQAAGAQRARARAGT